MDNPLSQASPTMQLRWYYPNPPSFEGRVLQQAWWINGVLTWVNVQ